MSSLPAGWAEANFPEIADVLDSRRIPLNGAERAKRPGPYPYYGANGLVDLIDGFLFEGPHVLLAEDGGHFDQPERGVAYVVEGRFWVNNHAHILQPVGGIDCGFLNAWLNATDWMPFVGGSTRAKLTQAGLGLPRFNLPPLAEQRRIMAKLDALTARSSRARDDLARIPALAARYKSALLARAFSGELTKGFQDNQTDVEGPSEYGALGLDDQERGDWTVATLPDRWAWRAFADLLDDVTDSRRKLPTKEYQPTGLFPIVDQGEVAVPGFTDREDMLNPAEPPVIVFGDHTRCVKFVTERFVQGADGVKVLKPRPHVVPRYAELMLRAINIPAKGYSRHMKFLRASYFPICGVAEQEEIVRRVDRAFSEIDRLTTDAAAAHRLLDRLDLAALKKAFRGNLVPQDPADEPASVLLDRIRAGRAATPKAKRRYSSRTSAVRKSDMPKSRLDNDVKHRPFLASILKASSTALSADSLFEAADLPITDFYKQLTWEIDNGFVKERDRMLEAA